MSDEQQLTHIDEKGDVRMVDVSAKADTQRIAVAEGTILMQPETLALIVEGRAAKGDGEDVDDDTYRHEKPPSECITQMENSIKRRAFYCQEQAGEYSVHSPCPSSNLQIFYTGSNGFRVK